jgi:hypothetical protein
MGWFLVAVAGWLMADAGRGKADRAFGGVACDV